MEFKSLSFSLAEHIFNKLQEYCKKTGQKQADVLRQAIYEFLSDCPIICEQPYVVGTYGNYIDISGVDYNDTT